jgi:FtsZ-binding cell division protein ZapB
MGVKLLQKSELQNLKAKEQTRQIEEGVKVATRIDGLRELYSKTEQELEKYRTATLMGIQKEISELKEKEDELSAKVKVLQAKYDSMKPDMEAKKAELKEYEKFLGSWDKKLTKREKENSDWELELDDKRQKTEFSLARQEDNERISINLLIEADGKRIEAEQSRQEARNMMAKADTERKDNEAAFILREFSISQKEKELSIMQTELMKGKKELEKEKIQVADQRATLQRSIARIKAGRQP